MFVISVLPESILDESKCGYPSLPEYDGLFWPFVCS